jgi:hypothetical protein
VWRSCPKPHIKSLHLSEKVEEIKKTYIRQEILNSLILRFLVYPIILFISILFLPYVSYYFILTELVYIIVILSFYTIFLKFKELKYENLYYIILTLDIIFVGRLFQEYALIYFLLPILGYLNSSHRHTIYTSSLASLQLLYYSFINENLSNLDVYIFLFFTLVLSFKNYHIKNTIFKVKNLIIEKIITKAHYKLLAKEGFNEVDNWHLDITHIPSELLGADFVAYKKSNKNAKDIMVTIGDVTSHGLDVSPVAYACLSIFHGIYTDDVTLILNDIDRIVKKLGNKLGGTTLCVVLKLKPDGKVIFNGSLNTAISLVKTKEIVDIYHDGHILGKNNSVLDFKEKELKLKPGESLVLATDGFAENDYSDDMTQLIITYKPTN